MRPSLRSPALLVSWSPGPWSPGPHVSCWSWSSGVLSPCWSPGLLVSWSPGLLVSWSPGLLVSWSPGPWSPVSCLLVLGLLVSWSPGLLVSWSLGLLVCWSPGLLSYPKPTLNQTTLTLNQPKTNLQTNLETDPAQLLNQP